MSAQLCKTATKLTSEQRLLQVLQATPEQQAAIDRILEGKTESRPIGPIGPLLLGMGAGAKFLGVSRATLWRIIQAGRLKKVEVLPGSFRVRRADLELLAEGHQASGHHAPAGAASGSPTEVGR